MANYGNTGQRYKMSRLVNVEAHGSKVLHNLDCGHSYQVEWDTPEKAQKVVGWSQRDLGKRQRCNKCG